MRVRGVRVCRRGVRVSSGRSGCEVGGVSVQWEG